MNENTPELLILAAGIGSRYGGLKQLDGMGPHDETIMEYSIYDAIRAGIKRVFLVINPAHRELIETRIISKFANDVTFGFVYQDLANLPAGHRLDPNRKKPWGTGHAVWVARDRISGPFAVINADDYYGADSFYLIVDKLRQMDVSKADFTAVGYSLKNTLSEHGSVSRGVCRVENGLLADVTEYTSIRWENDRVVYALDTVSGELSPDTIVSMNFWGFTPRVFNLLEDHLKVFLARSGDSETAEFFLPASLDLAIKAGEAKVRMLRTPSKWLGVTNPEDRESVRHGINALVKQGVYPEKL